MNRRDPYSSLFWLMVAIFVCWKSKQLDIGTLQSPGPGAFPFWSGFFLGALSIILTVNNFLKKKEGWKVINPWEEINLSHVTLTLIPLFIFAILIDRVGYLITTFGVMTLLFGLRRGPRPWVYVVAALITTMVTYFIFNFWLDFRLPKGIFGF